VSHDCDILSDDTPSHFYIFVFVCRIEMSFLPLQTKIDFIENVVILSFGRRPPQTVTDTSNDEFTISRIDWIRTRTQTKFPLLTTDEFDDLMLLSNTILTLEKAEAKAQFLLQQGKVITFHFILFLLFSHFFTIYLFSISSTASSASSTTR
jgi:hypothetical protein